MVRRKKVRTRGKLSLSKFFQKFVKGDKVGIVRESAMQPRFPKRLQGRTGVVEGKRGKAYIVSIKEKTKDKNYLIEPIHLKKIK